MDNLIITPDNAIALNKALENLIRCTMSLQQITLNLKPQAPATGNLAIELKEYCRELQRNARIQIGYSSKGLENLPKQGMRPGMVYRILQHMLYTAVQVPGADRIQLELVYDKTELTIQLQGDPAWMNEGLFEKQGGKYWSEMRRLLRRLKGTLHWQTKPETPQVLQINITGIA